MQLSLQWMQLCLRNCIQNLPSDYRMHTKILWMQFFAFKLHSDIAFKFTECIKIASEYNYAFGMHSDFAFKLLNAFTLPSNAILCLQNAFRLCLQITECIHFAFECNFLHSEGKVNAYWMQKLHSCLVIGCCNTFLNFAWSWRLANFSSHAQYCHRRHTNMQINRWTLKDPAWAAAWKQRYRHDLREFPGMTDLFWGYVIDGRLDFYEGSTCKLHRSKEYNWDRT